jgi:hypothetical protein
MWYQSRRDISTRTSIILARSTRAEVTRAQLSVFFSMGKIINLYVRFFCTVLFSLKIQLLVTVKITENNLIFFGCFYNSTNIEFETLIMLYSDSA